MSMPRTDRALIPRRLVVKVGTSTLCNSEGSPDPLYVADLASQVASLCEQGSSVVIVTSGAIRAGLDLMALPHQPKSMPIKQAAAAVGQGKLMQLYAEAFAASGRIVAQILLTRDDFQDRKRYVNASNTLRALLKMGIIPIVNENDTIAVDEIKVGDNDTLAALVAGLIDAELLLLLSDIEGLYDSDPNVNPGATLLRTVDRIDSSIEQAANGSKSGFGTGGMKTKIEAAKICLRSHIPMVIAHGRAENVIYEAVRGDIGTRFGAPDDRVISARKRWIAGGHRPKGRLIVHDAARIQLVERGKSLLPAGIVDLTGEFESGDLVVLVDSHGIEFAHGIVSYNNENLAKIKGLKTQQVKALLGEFADDEIVHRDNMVVIREPDEKRREEW